MKKNAFLSGSLMSMVEQGVSSLTSFLTGILIARYTTASVAGVYALILSVSMVLLGLQRVVVMVPFNVHFPRIRGKQEQFEYCAATGSIELIFLIVTCMVFVIANSFNLFEEPVNNIAIALFFCGYMLKDYARQYFFGIRNIGKCLIMSIIQCCMQVFMMFLFASKHILTLEGCLLIIGVTSVLTSGLFLFRNACCTKSFKLIKNVWNKNWWTAKWSISISMSDSIKNQLSVWMIKVFSSLEAVAVFNNNNTFSMLPQPVFNGLSQYLLPHLSELSSQNKWSEILKRINIAMFLAALCNGIWTFILLFFGKKIIGFLYGPEYAVSTILLIFCCLRGMFNSFSSITGAVLQAIEKPQIVVLSLIMSIVFLFTIGIFLTWKFNIVGMAAAMAGLFILTFIVQYIFLRRELKKNMNG